MTKLELSRYPGIRSFERTDQAMFFGRARETRALYEMVKVKPLTVLFAKSGIGKSSLLNAGLFPALEENNFMPVSIRLQDTSISPVETIKKVLEPFLNLEKLRQFGQQPYTLWEYVRACDFEGKFPVLVFDQFEELFSHERESRDQLTLALADLINERLPEAMRERLRQHPRQERSEALLDWFTPLNVKVLFAIRADRMSDLDALKHHIPTVLHDRFHLLPLSYDNAREAIVRPASVDDQRYRTPVFDYAPGAVTEILSALDNDQGEIESFQLQLLCSYLENKVTRKNQRIETSDFGGVKGVETILNDYYERELSALTPEEQTIARRFIEEGLIVNGRRVGVPEGAEKAQYGVTPPLLDKLLASRLLRAETIHLGKIYELSHDTLIEPILRSYEQRQADELLRETARQLEAERVAKQAIERKRNRAKMFAFAGFSLFGIALIAGVFAWINARKASISQKKAETTALAAKAWNIYRDDQTLAFRIAQYAYETDTSNAEALQTLQKIVNAPGTAFYQSVYSEHRFEITCAAFSPDENLVATGSFDTDIHIFERATGKTLHVLKGSKDKGELKEKVPGHYYRVNEVTFSPDGEKLYSVGNDGDVRIWSVKNGQREAKWPAHRLGITSMDMSRDGQYILTGSRDSTARLWSPTGQLLHTFAGHRNEINAVAISDDNQWILTGSADSTARLWRASGQCIRTIQLPGATVLSVAITPDHQSFVLGCSDNTARIFDINGQPINTLGGHTGSVVSVRISADGQYIATASFDGTARIWNNKGRELMHLVGHSDRLEIAEFSPAGRWIITGGFDYTAKIWDLKTNFQYKNGRHEDKVNKVKVSPDGSYIVSCSADRTLKKWDWEGNLLAEFRGHSGPISQFDFSPDGQTIISCAEDKSVRLWNTQGNCLQVMTDLKAQVKDVCFAPDGQSFTATSRDGMLAQWSKNSTLLSSRTLPNAAQAVSYSPDGKQLLTAGDDGYARLWSLKGDSLGAFPFPNKARMWDAVFSPDGAEIFGTGRAYTVNIWPRNADTTMTIFGHLEEIYQVAFSPDGQQWATASWDRTAKIWNRNHQVLHTLPHPDGVQGVCFSPDGKKIITACRDKIIRVWNADNGQLINTIGYRTDLRPMFTAAYIADLGDIPFDWTRYDISPELADNIYRKKPAFLVRQGAQYLARAATKMGDPDGCAKQLDEAKRLFLLAKKLDNTEGATVGYDSLTAETYVLRCNMLLLHKRFGETVAQAKEGMKYKPLDFLNIYEINGLLLNGQYDQALKNAQAIHDRKITQISYYADQTFGEVLPQELEFYRLQYGIESADEQRFLKAIGAD